MAEKDTCADRLGDRQTDRQTARAREKRMADTFPFAQLFAAADGVNRHPWSPQKVKVGDASPSTAVAAPGTVQQTIFRTAPRPEVTEAEVLRVDCGKDRFVCVTVTPMATFEQTLICFNTIAVVSAARGSSQSLQLLTPVDVRMLTISLLALFAMGRYVYRVASTPSGRIKDGSEVQLLANRDFRVARRCHRIFFAGDVVRGQKLHKLGKGDPAYIGKVQADVSQHFLTISGRKEAAPARVREMSEEAKKRDAAGTAKSSEFKRRGEFTAPSTTTTLEDTQLPRLVEFGIIVLSPADTAAAATEAEAAEAERGDDKGDEEKLTIPRIRVVIPHLDKHGHMR